jgi:hypothetical protein
MGRMERCLWTYYCCPTSVCRRGGAAIGRIITGISFFEEMVDSLRNSYVESDIIILVSWIFLFPRFRNCSVAGGVRHRFGTGSNRMRCVLSEWHSHSTYQLAKCSTAPQQESFWP